MRPQSRASLASFLSGVLLLAALGWPVPVVHAAPGSAYYKVRTLQKYQYYSFAGDAVTWNDFTVEGAVLAGAAGRDTLTTAGTYSVSATWSSDSTVFDADLDSRIDMLARVGAYHLLTNTLTVDVYVRGGAGTPYWISRIRNGQADASRLGGLPGSLAPLNGTSTATFTDSTVTMAQTGAVSVPINDTLLLTGSTTTTISVGGTTYSLARSLAFPASAWVTQSVCILGCMTEAATFDAVSSGHVRLGVWSGTSPLDVPASSRSAGVAYVRPSPNPARGRLTVAFGAPAGVPRRLEAFDLSGRRVALLHDGPGDAPEGTIEWDTAGLRAGLYFVRLVTPTGARTARVVIES